MNELVNYLLGILVFVVFSSPPLLSLFLLRRPSFWRVLLHVATAFYILLIIYIVYFFTLVTPPKVRRIYLLAGVFRRSPCRRVARGDGGWQTGETSLLRCAVALELLPTVFNDLDNGPDR
jgi:hypothetical protein